MDDLVVNNELTATIVDDESADGATALTESSRDTLEKTTLLENSKILDDVARLSHGNKAAVLADVEDAVGLVDGAEHALDDDRGLGVGDEGRLLVKLAGEEINTEVTVLASLGRGGDTDDLAGAALKDQDITDTDEVAGDADGTTLVTTATALNGTGGLC